MLIYHTGVLLKILVEIVRYTANHNTVSWNNFRRISHHKKIMMYASITVPIVFLLYDKSFFVAIVLFTIFWTTTCYKLSPKNFKCGFSFLQQY